MQQGLHDFKQKHLLLQLLLTVNVFLQRKIKQHRAGLILETVRRFSSICASNFDCCNSFPTKLNTLHDLLLLIFLCDRGLTTTESCFSSDQPLRQTLLKYQTK